MTTVRHLRHDERGAWQPLWEAYLQFYETVLAPEIFDLTWARFHDEAEPMHALGAFDADDRLVGLAHVIFHRSCWLPETTCYLQDLYVTGDQRGLGTGAALIDGVADLAREHRAGRLYWLTHESNDAARRLYERVAAPSGFIQYRKAL